MKDNNLTPFPYFVRILEVLKENNVVIISLCIIIQRSKIQSTVKFIYNRDNDTFVSKF